MHEHPHLRVIVESIRRYRDSDLDLQGLQLNLEAIMDAIEGDVPKPVRDAIYNAEQHLEIARFMYSGRAEVEKILCRLETIMARYYG